MKSRTQPAKSQRLRLQSREVERCGDVNRAQDKTDTFKVESWDNIKDKPMEIMLTKGLIKRLGWPIVQHTDGTWWVQVNKKK